MIIFDSKLCNEETYKHNGEKVDVIEYIEPYHVVIRFSDGTTATVYKNEIKSI